MITGQPLKQTLPEAHPPTHHYLLVHLQAASTSPSSCLSKCIFPVIFPSMYSCPCQAFHAHSHRQGTLSASHLPSLPLFQSEPLLNRMRLCVCLRCVQALSRFSAHPGTLATGRPRTPCASSHACLQMPVLSPTGSLFIIGQVTQRPNPPDIVQLLPLLWSHQPTAQWRRPRCRGTLAGEGAGGAGEGKQRGAANKCGKWCC